ncbi:MAG TPA: aldolase/citrate lyase family protein [Vicinamibacterales bacterium]|nr:aldolase/citrate lyase family protein [Vicinamibacterales bacterium]
MRLPTRVLVLVLALLIVTLAPAAPKADEPANNLASILAAGKPAIGIWTGAMGATRITKVLATSDLDFIVADVEHDIYDFRTLHSFLLEVPDFNSRYRSEPKPAPSVLIKLGHRAGWDPRFEIAESIRVGPASGVWVPVVESRAELERIISIFMYTEQSLLQGVNSAPTHEASELWPLNPKGKLMVVAMIETEEGVKNAKEIIETPGLAAVHTVHISADDAAKVLKLCLARNVIAGTNANPKNIAEKVAAGYKLISLGSDFQMLQGQLRNSLKEMRSALASSNGR